jgi:hypothetical protein
MTEMSYWWTTGGAGDGASQYTRADHQWITWITSACIGGDGVGPTFLNALVGSVPGANTARIATGVAIVDGKPYRSDANVDVTIPSAVGGGNTRIDRIVLRASWSAQTVRITRISGTDAGSPVAPALTQTSGTTYDIPLYQALVNTSGTVTLTDERQLAAVDTGDITLLAITTALINNLAVTEGKIGALAVTSGKIGANAVIAGKLADGAVDTTARLANDIVDDTKVGNRVPMLTRRQGGHATNWHSYGATDYTPTAVKIQCGCAGVLFSASLTGEVTVTYPQAFSGRPIVLVTNEYFYPDNIVSSIQNSDASYFVIKTKILGSTPQSGYFPVYWIAIGPE